MKVTLCLFFAVTFLLSSFQFACSQENKDVVQSLAKKMKAAAHAREAKNGLIENYSVISSSYYKNNGMGYYNITVQYDVFNKNNGSEKHKVETWSWFRRLYSWADAPWEGSLVLGSAKETILPAKPLPYQEWLKVPAYKRKFLPPPIGYPEP